MIVVFGGAFNPPTIAHKEMARQIIETLRCSKFLFLPVGDLYKKPGLAASFHRVQMLDLVCQELPRAEVSDLEAKQKTVLRTFETLELLQELYPEEEIAFVMGADNLMDLPNWYNYEQLLQKFRHIVFKREDLDIAQIINLRFFDYRDRFILLEAKAAMNVSSTLYRESQGNESLVPLSVSRYIKRHHLYGR